VLDNLLRDVRYAIRTLAKTPAFTATAVVTLAVGIGATVGIFSLVDAVLLRPLPIRDPARVAIITAQDVKRPGTVGASWTKYQMVRAQNDVFSGIAAYALREVAFTDAAGAEQIEGARVTWDFFSVLGVTPVLGRDFRSEEDVEQAAPVAVVTDGFWQRRLGAEPAALGRTIKIDGRETIIVGVLPADFRFRFSDQEPQIYLTSVFTPGVMTTAQIRSGAGFLEYVARLKPAVTFDRAAASLAAIDARYRQEFGTYVDAVRFSLHLVPFADNLVGDVRPALLVLMGAVGLLLLIACANVAHLLLARSAVRRREVAIRLALGASRSRLVRQFLTESLVLSVAGCATGVVAAYAGVRLLVAYGPSNIPRLHDVAPDGFVLLFAILVSVATAIGFGIMPALRATGISAGEALKDSRAGGLTSRAAGRLHNLLAASETAITVALLIAATLLFQSLVRMQAIDPGFDPHHVYAAQIKLPGIKYAEAYQREAFFTQLLQQLQAAPGISAAGATSFLPMSGANYGFFFFVDGQPSLGVGRDPTIAARHVSADYFRVMRIPVRHGRTFNERDDAQARPVAIINETTARRYFPDADPVGRHIANSRDGLMREIVGVVGDVRFDGPARSGQEELYLPYRQVPWPSMTVVIDSRVPAGEVVGLLRHEVARLDPDQAVAEVRPMERVVAASTVQQQFTSGLLGMFALLATTLATIGLYGVTTLFVNQRRHEFGIRMALGARQADVLLLVMKQGCRVILGGACVGVAVALAARPVLSGLLFGVTATDPGSYLSGTMALCVIGLIACYLPARRAVASDPIRALRSE